MEEKERYVLSQDFNPECLSDEYDYIVDSHTGKIIDDFDAMELLNKQEQENKQLKQSQKQLAIKVLQELRFAFNESIGNGMLRNYVCCLIDDKIKELGGGE